MLHNLLFVFPGEFDMGGHDFATVVRDADEILGRGHGDRAQVFRAIQNGLDIGAPIGMMVAEIPPRADIATKLLQCSQISRVVHPREGENVLAFSRRRPFQLAGMAPGCAARARGFEWPLPRRGRRGRL